DPFQSAKEIERLYEKTPGSLVLKPIWGGSPVGICVIRSLDDIQKKVPLWLDQMRIVHGEALFFVEKFLEGGRFLNVSFARFASGEICFFPPVDSSLASERHKLVEFCPAMHLDEETLKKMQHWSETLLEKIQYVGVGALEFMTDGSRAYLIGGLPRLTT